MELMFSGRLNRRSTTWASIVRVRRAGRRVSSCSGRASWRRTGDRLGLEGFTEAVDAVFATDTADAVAAEGRVGRQVERGSDVDRPGPKSTGVPPGSLWVR